MHLPDGLMHPALAALGWLVALAGLWMTHCRLRGRLDDQELPLMGLLAAGLFVAQMLNFPVGGGTSGHLLGAALATFLLGPLRAIVVMTVVLGVQGLFFGDGGVTAFGLNLFNMGLVGVGVAWLTLKWLPLRLEARVFVAGWLAVFTGALLCALELGVSHWVSGGDYGITFHIALPVMLGWHALIGLGEGAISAAAVAYINQAAPDMLPPHAQIEAHAQVEAPP